MRVLVCSDCLTGLVALGAEVVREKREGSLLDRCEAHPTNVGVHAMRCVDADPELVADWLAAERAPELMLAQLGAEDLRLVSSMAAQLLASGPGLAASPADMQQAAHVARELATICGVTVGDSRS